MNIKNTWGYLLALVLVMGLSLSCERQHIPIETTQDVLMGEYLEQNPELSEFLYLAELTNNLGFINAYGSYTFFIPTNAAFSAYLAKYNKTSLDEFSQEELDELFTYHIVNDTLSSIYFTDGKLKSPSMNNKYLITGVSVNNEGRASYVVNKQSLISALDVKVGNGYIHEVEQVLDPPKLTVAEMIKANPDYSIFTRALEETQVYDIINVPTGQFTVMVQNDSVYNAMGIESYEDLVAEYSHLGDPTNPEDSLNLYMRYHCLPGVNYMADIVLAKSHLTIVPQEVITVDVDGDVVMINDQTIAGTHYPGAEMNRPNSDNSASNGVYHELDGNIYIKVLLPVAVYWDPTTQPEMMKLSGIYKANVTNVSFAQGDLANMTWGGNNTSVTYWAEGYAVQNDVLDIYLRTSVIPWAELKTPLLIKGTYKVWVAYRANPYGQAIQTTFKQDGLDDQILGEILQIGNYGRTPSQISEDDLEAIGYKWYYNPESNRTVCRLVGIIEVSSTGQHTLRFDAITNNRGRLWCDMIQFIPADADQRWPKFDHDGNFIYEPVDTATVDAVGEAAAAQFFE